MSQFQIKPFPRANLTQSDTVTQSPSAPLVAEAPRAPAAAPQPHKRTRRTHRPTSNRQASIPRLETVAVPQEERHEKHGFVLHDMTAHAQPKTLYRVYEREGTGSMSVCSVYPSATLQHWRALGWLQDRALHWLEQGYAVTWHAAQTWFDATHEDAPTVYAVIQEVADA